jgi:terminase small subunit / prophage DNA-packing protein
MPSFISRTPPYMQPMNDRATTAPMRRELVPATEVEAEWSGVLRTVRAGILAVPSRVQQRLPHLTPHDVAEIDAEVRAALAEIGN